MPAVRRVRILALTVAFAFITLYYLNQRGNVWNYGYTPYLPKTVFNDGKTHWSKLPERYPVTSYMPLPTGNPKKIPKVQASAPQEKPKDHDERIRRRDAVRESFKHSWEGYKKHAWLRDEVTPLSGQYRDTFGGWAATLVDSLDTLWIMGMKEDFALAVKAIEEIDFTTTETKDINVFETTIRYMGGFLAAYDISGSKFPVLLAKAVEVGELLMSCFDTPNRMPISRWDWKKYTEGFDQTAPARMLVSELGSFSLEFTRLSQATGDPKYYDAIARIANVLNDAQNTTKLPGMWPVSIDAATPDFSEDNFFTLGGMSDSLYEYFPKHYLILGGLFSQPKQLYESFIEVAKQFLFFRFYNPSNLPVQASGDIRVLDGGNNHLIPRGQHLTCFTGGMVGLASRIFNRPQDLETAEELTQGCIWAYDAAPNHIAPELYTVIPCPKDGACDWADSVWHDVLKSNLGRNGEAVEKIIAERNLWKGIVSVDDRRYILRPEAIESVFMMWRITGKQIYQEAAWRMFQAVEAVSRTDVAAAAIADITVPSEDSDNSLERQVQQGSGEEPIGKREDGNSGGSSVRAQQVDSMESFWLAETLKYFFLCFEEFDVVSLDEWVLNTEAHPLRRPR
ncbi:glycoside hydrolase family 47 protein [Stipitochalara longipes BDJ]|nr:glycoside hydrolase family 47 protein [Stipitochalara longipes BDJ]